MQDFQNWCSKTNPKNNLSLKPNLKILWRAWDFLVFHCSHCISLQSTSRPIWENFVFVTQKTLLCIKCERIFVHRKEWKGCLYKFNQTETKMVSGASKHNLGISNNGIAQPKAQNGRSGINTDPDWSPWLNQVHRTTYTPDFGEKYCILESCARHVSDFLISGQKREAICPLDLVSDLFYWINSTCLCITIIFDNGCMRKTYICEKKMTGGSFKMIQKKISWKPIVLGRDSILCITFFGENPENNDQWRKFVLWLCQFLTRHVWSLLHLFNFPDD